MIKKLINKFFPKSEKEIRLENRLNEIEDMQKKLELFGCNSSIRAHFNDLVPKQYMEELQFKIDFLCSGHIYSENYQLIVDSLISKYSGKANEFVSNLINFKTNYKNHMWHNSDK